MYVESLVKNIYEARIKEHRPVEDMAIIFESKNEEVLQSLFSILKNEYASYIIETFEPLFHILLRHDLKWVKVKGIDFVSQIFITAQIDLYYKIFQYLDDPFAGVEKHARVFFTNASEPRLDHLLDFARDIHAPQAHIEAIELWANLNENSLADIIPYLQSDDMLQSAVAGGQPEAQLKSAVACGQSEALLKNVGLVAAVRMKRLFDDEAALEFAANFGREEIAGEARKVLEG